MGGRTRYKDEFKLGAHHTVGHFWLYSYAKRQNKDEIICQSSLAR